MHKTGHRQLCGQKKIFKKGNKKLEVDEKQRNDAAFFIRVV